MPSTGKSSIWQSSSLKTGAVKNRSGARPSRKETSSYCAASGMISKGSESPLAVYRPSSAKVETTSTVAAG